MPIYEYQCPSCSAVHEYLDKTPLEEHHCPDCEERDLTIVMLTRKLSAHAKPAPIFYGVD